MEETKIIYHANFSGIGGPVTELNLIKSFCLSEKVLNIIYLAIAFSKRHKADIDITKRNSSLNVILYIQFGTFIGSMGKMFAQLIELTDDMLIMPEKSESEFMLKATLSYNQI